MPSYPLKPQKGSDILMEHLKRLILTGEYEPGARLPTMVEMSERFQVGRSTVREALSGLKATGYIDIRHGGGTFVSKQLPENAEGHAGIFLHIESFKELLEVRKFIETGCVALAARYRTDADMERIADILVRMEEALDDEELAEQADVQLHLEIAKASHNSLLIQMMESFTMRLQDSMKESRRLWFFAERASAEQLLREHQGIVEAVRMKNEALAGERMAAHIYKVDKVLHRLLQKS